MTKLRALIIDDLVQDVELTELALIEQGFVLSYQHAFDYKTARQALEAKDWDIVLTDHSMPGFSSYGVLELLAELEVETPCIVVSGAIGEEAAVDLLQKGAVDYINKGKLLRLGQAIERALREAENERARAMAEEALLQANIALEQRVKERTCELSEANSRLARESAERAQTERALMAARLRLTQLREDARRQLARDLHDNVLQELIGMAYGFAENERAHRAAQQVEIATALGTRRHEVMEVVKRLRNYIKDLRPPGLEELGLNSALEELVESAQLVAAKSNTRLSLTTAGNLDSVPEAVAYTFLQVTREAIRNALEHASASSVSVHMAVAGNEASVEIKDDGTGFKVPQHLSDFSQRDHFGMVGMDEYSHLIGGVLQVHSAPGEGSTICLRAPLKKVIHEAL